MARKSDEILQLAAKGVRDRMTDLLEEVVRLKQLLPNLSPLAQVQAALSATIDYIDGSPRRRTPRMLRVEIPDRVVARVTNGERKHKPRPRKKALSGDPRAAIDAAKARSWEKGRALLVELSDHDGGLTVPELAKKLKLSDGATYARLKVREKHGHVKLIDADKKLWGVVPDGRLALRNDRDSEL
jgi:hypothetical protein